METFLQLVFISSLLLGIQPQKLAISCVDAGGECGQYTGIQIASTITGYQKNLTYCTKSTACPFLYGGQWSTCYGPITISCSNTTCSNNNPRYYLNFNNGSNITYGVCWSNGDCSGPAVLDGFCPPLPDDSGSNLGLILGIAGGAIAVIAIIVGVVIYRRRQAKKSAQLLG